MEAKLIHWLSTAWQALSHSHFMPWNLFLALIPLFLSLWLFLGSRRRHWLWWLIFAVFIAFLPNAPYVLTDTIHLIDLIRQGHSVWIITLVLIPQYFLFIFAGVQAYVISVMLLGHYLHRQGKSQYILSMELLTHILCAVGIYLGRFKRFNSWDFLAQPNNLIKTTLDELTTKQPLIVIGVTFVVLVAIYWFIKQVNLGIVWRVRYRNPRTKSTSVL